VARVCVVGSVNVDLVFEVAALPEPGETVLASAVRTGPGGKGGNQAVAAARAGGAQVVLVAAVGTDAAAETLRSHLARNGVGLDGLTALPVASGTAAIIVGTSGSVAAENMIVVAQGANAHLTLDSPRSRDLVTDCDLLLLQLEVPVDTALRAARLAHSAGATVMLNASPSSGADLAELAATVDVVVVNESEEARWRWPVPHLVTTRGSRGATYCGDDGQFDVASPVVQAIDTTGAGDVFAGVLAAGWIDGHRRALRRACAAGALATLVAGAGDCAPGDDAIEDALATAES
jgi:ribokinase